MEEINYLHEHLWYGQLGRYAAIFAFIFSILGTVSYFLSKKDRDEWDKLATISIRAQFVAVITMVGLLFTMLTSHFFEYHYVYNHSSAQLPFYYQFASFWEGQEGSFMLWLLFQSLIGVVLTKTCSKNRGVILGFYSLILVFLSSMLLGVYIGDFKLGSSPFLLFREAQANMPLFRNADYLRFITDGTGLNPLLQNYWMVIHPPTLFFGYALMAVPFVYAVGNLVTNNDKVWIKSTLNWSLLGGGILGLGVLMGGAWAYEALSFGGFWAWDPVENASILPWILLVAGMHTLLAFKNRGYSKKITLIFMMSAFVAVLYSSFLTRSGILGDSSVHSFTGNGMMEQLLVFLITFLLIPVWLLIKKWKFIPSPDKEEATSSREFWLFFGSLILLLSWLQIIFFTSIPVYNVLLAPIESTINSLFGSSIDISHNAPPIDVISFYNSWQLPFGMLLSLLTAVGFFLKYKSTKWSYLLKRLSSSLISAIILGVFVANVYGLDWKLCLFLIFSIFSVLTNLIYIIEQFKANVFKAGGVIAHLGFALLMVGIILSSGAKEVISINNIGVKYGEGYDDVENHENILLYKNAPMQMGKYNVTYVGDSTVGVDRFFKIHYEQTDSLGQLIDEFYLYPNVQDNPKFGKAANPDTRHFLSHDIFTHVTSVSDIQEAQEGEYQPLTVKLGDTTFLSKVALLIRGLERNPQHELLKEGDLAIGLDVEVRNLESAMTSMPIFVVRDGQIFSIVHDLKEMGVALKFDYIDPDTEEITISVNEFNPIKDFIILKAIKFPWMNIVWMGVICLFFGFMTSLYNRKIKSNAF